MGFMEQIQFISVATVLVGAIFFGKGTCDSICPNGITNITASSGVLAYPNSGDYGINETKCWKIEVPDTYKGIYYIYNRLDIEICKGCECDGIQFATPSSYDYLPSSNKVCRRYSDKYLEYRRRLGNPESGFESETALYVRFVSDDTVHRKGFNVSFIAYSDIPADGVVSYLNATEDETIEFGTPKVGIQNYPESYGRRWILIVPEGRRVKIDFDIFELEQSEDCKNDYIEFREANFVYNDPTNIQGYRGPILTGRLCGSSKPSTIQSKGNMVWVQFVSDDNSTTVYQGFKAIFKAGQERLSVSNPLTLLFLSAWLVISLKNGVF
ncbi:bone morphogenetic protein 1-like [Oculina patagonica]